MFGVGKLEILIWATVLVILLALNFDSFYALLKKRKPFASGPIGWLCIGFAFVSMGVWEKVYRGQNWYDVLPFSLAVGVFDTSPESPLVVLGCIIIGVNVVSIIRNR